MSDEKTGADYPELTGRTLLGVPVDTLPMDDETAAMLGEGFARMDDIDRAAFAMSFSPPFTGLLTWRRYKSLSPLTIPPE